MRRIVPLILALVGVLPVAAQEEPQAILRRAIQAVGGEERLARVKAVHSKIKGVLHDIEGAAFTGEVFRQDGGRLRYHLRTDISGNAISMVTVVEGDNTWLKINDQVEPTDKAVRDALRRGMHADRVALLLPLLQDKAFTLAALGESVKDGRPVLGVKVSHKEMPEVRLFFDKEKAFLTRVEYRGVDDTNGKEIDSAVVYHEYREIAAVAAEEATLKAAKVAADGPALLEYLRKRTLSDAARERLLGLVRKLGSEDFAERETASRELIAAGGVAVPFLTRAAQSQDAEVAQRAKFCLEKIQGDTDTGVTTAVVRLLGQRRPSGTAAALLDFLSSAGEEKLAREVHFALAEVAHADGKPDQALEDALNHKDTVRRDAARVALAKDGGKLRDQASRRLYLAGVKVPTRITEYRDGKKIMNWERLEVWFFNKFEEAVFAKP